jgi:hypothetical protein
VKNQRPTSETSSDNGVEILEEVTSTTTPGQTPGQVYDAWSRGLASTSTPTNDDPTRARRGEIQIGHLRGLIQENQQFYNLFNQPDSTWPANLDKDELKLAYARAYAVVESEFPVLLAGDEDLPHPSEFESDAEGPESDDDDVVAVTDQGSTTTNTAEVTSETLEGPVGSGVIGPIFNTYVRPRCEHRSPIWPPPPLWQQVRPGPIPTPSSRFSPVPSTSAGMTRPAWYGSKYGLVPMNQDAKKLWADGFTTEVAISKVLAEKAEMSGVDSTRKVADTFNEILRKQVGRRARILEVFKNQQARYEHYINNGMALPNPNPGAVPGGYRGNEIPSETWHGEFEEDSPGEISVEPEPEDPSVLSSDQSEPGKCSPKNCVCNGKNCIWENANYTD